MKINSLRHRLKQIQKQWDTKYTKRITVHHRGRKFVYKKQASVLIPILRKLLPKIIAADIVGVQPMSLENT